MKACSNCGCKQDSHFENKHACLTIWCKCEAFDAPKKEPKKQLTGYKAPRRPHGGTCNCKLCMDWIKGV